jgi:hypothetical protein
LVEPVATQRASRFVDLQLLDRVALELRDIERRNGMRRTLAIGELILTEFFGGNVSVWRDRRRSKNNSIRRLAERPECPFCKSALNEAVAVYIASRELPCVRTSGHIGPSHVAAVLALPADQRNGLLEHAEREQLSVRRLRDHIVSLRRSQGERRGRPPMGREERALAELAGTVSHLSSLIASVKAAGVRDADRPQLRQHAEKLAGLTDALLVAAGAGPDVTAARRGVDSRVRTRSA